MLSPTIFFTCHPLLCLAPVSNFFPRHPHTVFYIIFYLDEIFAPIRISPKTFGCFPLFLSQSPYHRLKSRRSMRHSLTCQTREQVLSALPHLGKNEWRKRENIFFKFLWCYIYIYTFFQSHKTRQNESLVCFMLIQKNISETEYQQNKRQFKWRTKTMWEDFWNNYCYNRNQIEKSR